MTSPLKDYMKDSEWYLGLTTKLTTKIEFKPKIKEVTVESAGLADYQEKLKEKGIGYACQSGIADTPNQDDLSIISNPEMTLIGVSDGHGPYGHYCSYILQQMLPKLLLSSLHYPKDIPSAIADSFLYSHEALKEIAEQQKKFNISMSGTTSTVLFFDEIDKKLFVGHVGDTRAIIGRKTDNGIVSENLTLDHNMNVSKEYARILFAEGDIRKANNEGPLRFYCKGTDYPGLVLSRTIGDTISKMYGIICNPDIKQVKISDKDLFVVVCSDGVWEKMNKDEVAAIVSTLGKDKAEEAAKEIVSNAQKLWKADCKLHYDDISCVVYWLN